MIKERHGKTFETALSQGKVDEQMESLCRFISGTKGYYTSSCCSGRIMLLEKRGDRKKDNLFHRKWHREVSLEELLEGLRENTRGELWFKLEPFILHIGCANLRDSVKVLGAMKNAGVKRGGIIVAEKEKFLIELQGTERMSFRVKISGRAMVGEDYIDSIFPMANRMLAKNYSRLERLESEFRKTLR
ncbi:MAG: hypothetical protein HY544_03260 [Candidatus Diapherotrites archaeon]|uniref:tRNA(Phe) 7-((3-amino-3-carboxypropyl)-4-demethylwyosine(37)-N(4))-methyltransferase n=1 Tax=Candidatus Iainarchaeum sp. TaxID=3101447 RepID=A0A8T3YMI1_9ARCH|nr:hypothetical protein [Candidatus Diapherotrites archaeon]